MDTGLWRESEALSELGPRFYSALRDSAGAAPYDRKAALYDAIVGQPLYHRIVWGTRASSYSEFGRSALAQAGSEPFAEVACGSLLFTAAMYRGVASQRMVISDRSLGMLERATRRLASLQRPVILHADAANLPLQSHTFASVLSLNLLHVPCDRAAIVAEFGRLLIPGRGRLYATCLVRTGRWSDAALSFYHRVGELGVALTREGLIELLGALGHLESLRVEGNMAFVVVRRSG